MSIQEFCTSSQCTIKEGEYYAADIRDVIPRELPEFDAICGGFPCQSFSIAGNRGGFEDTRGTLFFEIARIIQERKPRIVFLENVRGLLSHDRGRTFGTILSTLSELGYDVEWQICNSRYFGVPQNRERVFIIGHLRGQCRRTVFPIGQISGTTNESQGVKQVGNIVNTGNWDNPQRGRIYSPDGISPSLNTCGGGGLEPKIAIPVLTPDRLEKKQNGRRFKENGEPMFTLTAQDKHGVMVKQATKQDLRIRKLTPKECFRLQGFPDELFEKAQAVNSNSQLYKQAGNSVTVPVIYEISKRLRNVCLQKIYN